MLSYKIDDKALQNHRMLLLCLLLFSLKNMEIPYMSCTHLYTKYLPIEPLNSLNTFHTLDVLNDWQTGITMNMTGKESGQNIQFLW